MTLDLVSIGAILKLCHVQIAGKQLTLLGLGKVAKFNND